jgi:ubiquinone/menaquinone biosynthesis C-methylase UbiE
MKRAFDPSHPEMVDRPDADPRLLREEMVNLRKINRRFGGIPALRREIAALASNAVRHRPLRILDLATGSADVPVALIDDFTRAGRPVRITAVDRNEVVLQEASRYAAGDSSITFVRGDILELGYPDVHFDIVLCSLALHHFALADAVWILREMERLSAVGFVLSDLRRSYPALCGAWLYTRLTTRNIMTRTDAIASVRAAFTEAEIRDLLARAGVADAAIRRVPGFRLMVTRRKG